MKDIGYLDKGMWGGLGFYIATRRAGPPCDAAHRVRVGGRPMKFHPFFEVGLWFGLGFAVAMMISAATLVMVAKVVKWLGS